MRILVGGGEGAIGAKISREHDRITFWVDRVDRDRKLGSAGGVSVSTTELEALIWKLASLRAHMVPAAPALPQVADDAPLPPRVSLSTSYRPRKPTLKTSLAEIASRRKRK